MNAKSALAGILLPAVLLPVCASALAAKPENGTVVSLRGGTLERLDKNAWREIAQGQKVGIGERLRPARQPWR